MNECTHEPITPIRLRCPVCIERMAMVKWRRDNNPIGEDFRLWIYERDGYRCRFCGSAQKLSIDHIVPVWYDGRTDPDNLQTLCMSCNQKKGASADYALWLEATELDMQESDIRHE